MYFFDVGANIGLHSLFASKRIGSEGKVIAFEPCESTYKRLVENVNLNKPNNIYVFKLALGDNDCEMDMIKITSDTSKTYIRQVKSNNKDEIIEIVKLTTLDNFIRNNNIKKIDYLKIDVEGFELNVLKGAITTLTNIIPAIIQLEIEPFNLKEIIRKRMR